MPRTPAEIAEANRIKDEAADDALFVEWLSVAEAALEEYRGEPVVVLLPGCNEMEMIHLVTRTKVRNLDRFVDRLRAVVEPAGWYANPTAVRNSLRLTHFCAVEFGEMDWSIREGRAKPPTGDEPPELPEPIRLNSWGEWLVHRYGPRG